MFSLAEVRYISTILKCIVDWLQITIDVNVSDVFIG
jgi:hypothetical protein